VNHAVVPALARVEARHLLRHPGTVIGLMLTGLIAWLVYTESDGADALFDPANTFLLPVLLLAWGLLIAANLGALRSRRFGTGDLLASTPTVPAARTLGHAGGALVGVPVAALIMFASTLLWRARPASIGWPHPALVLTMLLIVAGGAVVGVLLAQWLPHPVAGAGGVIATIILQSNLGQNHPQGRWLHFAPGDSFDTPFDVGPAGWHVVYVAALVALGIALAVARHGLPRPVATALAAIVLVVGVTGWIQMQPPTGAAVAKQVARLNDPVAHQVCERHGGVRYCAWSEYRGWIDEWRKPVAGVLALAPAAVHTRVAEVRQMTGRIELIPQIERRVDRRKAWPADGEVHPGLHWYEGHELALGYQAAARLVGLPASVGYRGWGCSAAGQARVIVALWLAGEATPAAHRALRHRSTDVQAVGYRALVATVPLDVIPDYENGQAGEAQVAEVGSAGRGSDIVAAAILLALPVDRVSRAVADNWDRLTASGTPASAVFDVLGLAVPSVLTGRPPVVPGVSGACR
jgi:hypothetical protein